MSKNSYNVAGEIRPSHYYEPRSKRNARQQKAYVKRVAMWRLFDFAMFVLLIALALGVALLVEAV